MYTELRWLEKSGQIRELRLQPRYTLIPSYLSVTGEKVRPMIYVADFEFWDVAKNRRRVLDAKGFRTKEFIIKKKLFEYQHLAERVFIEEQI